MTAHAIGRWLELLVLALALPTATAADVTPPAAATAEQLLAVELFTAIADKDTDALRLALNSGADPNAGFPSIPEAKALCTRYDGGPMEYYLRGEPGYTALMFAAALGNQRATRYLLLAGADKNRLSGRSKTFALWQAAHGGHIEVMKLLMGITPASECARYRVDVDLATQRATIRKGSEVVLTTAISSGAARNPTPPGRYLVTDKYRTWRSTIYPARMPYFLRLSCGDFGFHAGALPGYPASHGCVRLPEENARIFYSTLPVGTLVVIR